MGYKFRNPTYHIGSTPTTYKFVPSDHGSDTGFDFAITSGFNCWGSNFNGTESSGSNNTIYSEDLNGGIYIKNTTNYIYHI